MKLAQQAQLCAEQQAQLARLRTKQQAQLAQLWQHAAEKAQECERRVRREAQEQLEPFSRDLADLRAGYEAGAAEADVELARERAAFVAERAKLHKELQEASARTFKANLQSGGSQGLQCLLSQHSQALAELRAELRERETELAQARRPAGAGAQEAVVVGQARSPVRAQSRWSACLTTGYAPSGVRARWLSPQDRAPGTRERPQHIFV